MAAAQARSGRVGSGWQTWSAALQRGTERLLTGRRRRKLRRRERHRRRNPVVDWLDAIGSAVLIVLVINQFLFQAYKIPSQSMRPTLEISDRIFVNKLVYGPELVPGQVKLPGPRRPGRGEVVIFENPTYEPIGPLKDILKRIIYMLTLSMVDIDRDQYGNAKPHILIKRAIGVGGDRIRLRRGEVQVLLPGADGWSDEATLQAAFGLDYPTRRSPILIDYDILQAGVTAETRLEEGLALTEQERVDLNRWKRRDGMADPVFRDQWRLRTKLEMDPTDRNSARQWQLRERGWVVPAGTVFPLGDNRDESRDGRYFGPVTLRRVLGKAMFHYWPPTRWAAIR
ncbi:MAG: signal peptidase I [Spirochaetaceae bacterium]|nr:signal peptidase I [Spirochaetaceae bacterium]